MAASALLQGLVLLLALLTLSASARIVPAPLSQQAQLAQIRNNIQQQGAISAATVGEKLALQVDVAFHSGNVTVGYLNATLTDSSLIVLGKASVWNTTVFGTFTFFFATPTSTDVQLQLQFNAAFEFATLYRAVFPAATVPAVLGNVKATEQLSVVFSTFAYASYPAGLTVSSTAVLPGPASANVLTQALATLRSSAASTLTYGTYFYIPLFSANPQDINLKLTEQGSFALTSSIQCSAYQLSVSASSATSFALSVDLAISVQNQAQPVSFSANALWKANTTISFAGSLSGAWAQPFGANWLSITSAAVTFDVSLPAKADRLSVLGKAVFSFAPQAQPTSFSATILPSGDFAVSVAGLPVNSVDALYSAVARTPTPAVIQGIALSGSVNFALASFANGAVAKGFTLSATVTLAPGSTLDKAAKTLAASTQQFAFTLFVPVYSSNVQNVDFSLVVSGGFAVTRSVSVTNYRIAVTISQQTTIGLSATTQVALANQPQPLTFNVAANWQENALTTFQGSLQGTWQNPFDLAWLRFVSSVTLSISVASSGPASATQVSITGTGILAAAPSSPFNFAIDVRETGDWLFSVSKFPISTASSFYAAVTGSSSATPAILNDVNLQGTAALAIATYSSGGVSQGLTLSASATASGSLSKAAATLRVGSTQSYQFALFVPLFGATGSSTVSLSESGAIPLASFLQINSYSVSATLSSAPSISIAAAASVIVPEQSEPITIQVNAQWNEQSTTTSFVGQLASWQHPMGLSWLSFQGLSVNLVVTSGQVTQFSYSGKALLSFSSSPVTATVSFDNKGDIVLTVSNIPINSLDQLYRDVVGVVAPYYLKELSVLQGSASFTVATASIGGARKGLTLTAQAQLTDGTLSKAVQTLIAAPASKALTFGLNLFVPIFDADPAAISLALTESGSFSLSSNIRFQQFQLSLVEASGQQPSIDLSTQMAITLAQQGAQPLVFSVSGKWVADTSVAFAGQLVGQWNQPFGARWLAISAASVSVNVRLAVVQSLAFAGGAVITFDGASEDVSFAITTSNDFVDTTLVAQTSAKWSLSQVAASMVGNVPAIVTDVNENTASLTLILSTYAHDNVKTGFTIQTKGDIKGELLRRVKSLQSRDMGSLQWTVGLNIPLYTSNPVDLSLTLEVDDNIRVTKDFAFERLALEVDAAPLAISAETEFQANFTNNSPLLFNVLGKFNEDGDVILEGDMIGTWENVFGFKNFDVSDVALEIGFNPAVCVVDGACLSDLGIGFNLTMGTKYVLFDGNVAAPDFEDIFARGAIAGANGMAFTILDVVLEWNRMIPQWPIPTSAVPANWGLTDSSFYFAPRDGTFGGIAYKEGFAFNSGITLLDMDLDLNVSCSKEYTDFCDFSFHVDLNWDLFYKMLKHEVDFLSASTGIEGDVGEVIIFSLDSVSLTEWSTKRYASGKHPRWQIGITVFDKKHNLDFEVEQWELASSFSSFFHKWLRHIF